MSGERAPLAAAGGGVLRGSRSVSYGSLVRSPVRQRRIEHKLQPGETLQGLALKYGVSMEQIKRANRLYTNESIFLKSTLLIPVLSDFKDSNNGMDLAAGDNIKDDPAYIGSEKKKDDGQEVLSDLTPVDFLKRLDDLITHSKQAAVKGCKEAEERVAALEAACSSRTSALQPLRRSQSIISPSRMQEQQAAHGAVPLTITKLTKNFRDEEDEIFKL
ncbi:lysM and putative peptidoglycan-binding domain-containing protein 1 [Betta splendens]|uniref:LysM and putative peptidoglycan-binding domain-containing protein 1 n=1 Tax=Betta splendens TaxID=158456 RepID=A0A6P7KVU7_BETSP|nr:lysM and putative peptidoglycan-binding domain-containing protein 1 [Betta splendens]XP_028984723.1 lysM and putative peptidoglycan-binding domain-containing protein 1 [Betta splendens]XP_028984724.1 lysM and putative peptidoglycan-binding domain-containing protein 1 [Betta splendens]